MGEILPQPDYADTDAPVSDVRSLQTQLADATQKLRESEALRQAASEREAVLRGELLHRVRNTLAIIRSIFSRTMTAGGTAEDIGNHFRGRLDTIARYQPPSAMEVGGTVDFEAMVRDELHSFRFGEQPNITILGEDVRLSVDMAQLFGLALHELATNSIKFGALSSAMGHGDLRIEWHIVAGALHFEWRETGVRVLGSAPLREGFGRQFIEQAMPYQIGALTSFELRPGGVFCTIVAPLEPVITHGLATDF